MERSEQFTLSRGSLLTLVGALTGSYPNPDDPDKPPGPWGPIIRLALNNLALDKVRVLRGPQPEPWGAALGEPQPIPWRLAIARALADVMTERVVQFSALAEALPDDARASVQRHNSKLTQRFIDDCGNGTVVIHVPKGWPWPPSDDEPKPIGPLELVVMGTRFAQLAAGQPELVSAGEQLIELGLRQMQPGASSLAS